MKESNLRASRGRLARERRFDQANARGKRCGAAIDPGVHRQENRRQQPGGGGIVGPAREGKVQILAAAGGRRSPAFSDVPTFQEQGIPVAMDIWRGIGAPKGTPRSRIAKLETAFEQASKDPVFVEASKKYGFAIRYLNSVDFGKFMNEDDRMLSGVLEKMGLKKQ